MKANDVTLLTSEAYFRDVAQTVAKTKAGDRAALITMSVRPDQPLIDDMVREFEAAARRGVEVYFAFDAYNFLKSQQGGPGPLWPRTTLSENLQEPYRGRVAVLERIIAAGGHCAIINMPSRAFSPVHGGRSHIKAAIISDTVYVGGCNLNDSARLDVMAKWQSHKAADWVFQIIQSVVERGSTQAAFGNVDRQFELNDKSTLLIDAGAPDQSAILQNAYQLIDDAEDHVFITCQFFPGGPLGHHLKAASERGVQITIRYSHPAEHGILAPVHHLYTARERTRMPAAFFTERLAKGRPLLHAKVICTEKGAMLGSHNYVVQGVHWGTAEIALRYNSPAFSDNLRAFMLQQIDV